MGRAEGGVAGMGLLKKNFKWHICITNDDSYCAHGHTRTNRCVNGYICMYVVCRSLLVHIVGVSLAGTSEERRPRGRPWGSPIIVSAS